MNHLLKGAALAVAFMVATPVWAQTSEDLNRQELNRLSPATTLQPVAPFAAPAVPAPQAYPAPAYPAAAYPAAAYPYQYPTPIRITLIRIMGTPIPITVTAIPTTRLPS